MEWVSTIAMVSGFVVSFRRVLEPTCFSIMYRYIARIFGQSPVHDARQKGNCSYSNISKRTTCVAVEDRSVRGYEEHYQQREMELEGTAKRLCCREGIPLHRRRWMDNVDTSGKA
jgi:hypothetical protein